MAAGGNRVNLQPQPSVASGNQTHRYTYRIVWQADKSVSSAYGFSEKSEQQQVQHSFSLVVFDSNGRKADSDRSVAVSQTQAGTDRTCRTYGAYSQKAGCISGQHAAQDRAVDYMLPNSHSGQCTKERAQLQARRICRDDRQRMAKKPGSPRRGAALTRLETQHNGIS